LKISIIICTYNPNSYLLGRLLNAINYFDSQSPPYEVIIVDNNSTSSLNNNNEVTLFLESNKNASIIFEKKPGLTSARTAGINASKYDWIVFFDDDNEPHPSYLVSFAELIQKYPKVGAWGPGIISVKYIKRKETRLLRKIKWLFQERHYVGDNFDNNTVEGSKFYPHGTGMILRKDILFTYLERVESGRYTMTDRLGNNLTSAGDTQILFTCIQHGYYAGCSSKLILNHLIDRKKSTLSYAEKLIFALNSSHLLAYNEVFPNIHDHKKSISNCDVIKLFISTIRLFRSNNEEYSLRLFWAQKCGELNARVVAYDLKAPFLLYLYKRLIR
jgi:glycosyltransferase involved in cell wall biosynthesis